MNISAKVLKLTLIVNLVYASTSWSNENILRASQQLMNASCRGDIDDVRFYLRYPGVELWSKTLKCAFQSSRTEVLKEILSNAKESDLYPTDSTGRFPVVYIKYFENLELLKSMFPSYDIERLDENGLNFFNYGRKTMNEFAQQLWPGTKAIDQIAPRHCFRFGEFQISRIGPDGGETTSQVPSLKKYRKDFKFCGLYKIVILPKDIVVLEGASLASIGLKEVILPEGLEVIGGAALSRNLITNVKIPKTVKKIYDHAFHFNKLTSIEIPNSVTYLGRGAFMENELTRISISNNLTII